MISFVYFDLGGVVDKDFSASRKWDDLREELKISPSIEYDTFWKEVERDICTRKEVDDLLPILQDKFGAHFPTNYSLLDTFVKRFEKNESIWPVIAEVKKSAKIGLLTMMYPHMLAAIEKSGILPKVKWDEVIDSSVVGLIKADRQIYETAQEKAGVPGSEILFIDNTQRYLDIAKEFGWQTFFYDSSNYDQSSADLLDYFRKTVK